MSWFKSVGNTCFATLRLYARQDTVNVSKRVWKERHVNEPYVRNFVQNTGTDPYKRAISKSVKYVSHIKETFERAQRTHTRAVPFLKLS